MEKILKPMMERVLEIIYILKIFALRLSNAYNTYLKKSISNIQFRNG